MRKLIRLAVGCLLVLGGCKTRREKEQVIVIEMAISRTPCSKLPTVHYEEYTKDINIL